MNYEATIPAETQDGTPADALDGAQHEMGAGAGIGASPLRKLLIAGFALTALLLVLGAIFALTGGDEDGLADDSSQAPVVTVITPGRTTVEGAIEAPGTIAARRPMPVGVVGEGGQVLSVRVDAGDWVSQGQVLAVIDRSVQAQQAAAQEAQIGVAKADADLAQANLDRALQLVERGFISKAEVDRLTSIRDAAVARISVAQAQLRELRARTARLNVKAPAAGYILQRSVEPGQTVGTGSGALFTIARGGEFEMLAQLGEAQLASLAPGVSATVLPAGSDKSFTGQVWQISPTVDERSRQGTARIALSFAPELRPGGFATATIASGTVTATVLPESAVLADDAGSYVYVVNEESQATRTAVVTGMATADGIAITEGLEGDEAIVLRAGGFLNPGETVKTRTEASE